TGIDGHPCHGDGRHPEDQRWLDALLRRMRRDAATGVVTPETHLWPSVVATGQDDVDLVAAIGSILVLPDLPGHRMGDQTERIAMTECENLRPITLPPHEGVIGWNRAVVVEPQHLAAQAHRILRDVRNVPFRPATGGHVDLAVTA